MDNVIAYSFFSPKKIYEHRFWDNFNVPDRYWYNIPAVVAVNSILYPEFEIKIHFSSSIKRDSKYYLLEELSEEFKLTLQEETDEYSQTEPTIWRYQSIFDKTHDIVLSRDIDSIPNKLEFLSTKFFIDNPEYKVTTLRTHTNHTSNQTIILAGLCGFRPKEIEFLQSIDYKEYHKSVYNNPWGLDQNSLIKIFTIDRNWTRLNFLDSRISGDLHKVGNPLIPCVSRDEKWYTNNVRYDENLDILLDFLDRITVWPGEPVNIRGRNLKDLLNMDFKEFSVVKEIIESNKKLRDFYQI